MLVMLVSGALGQLQANLAVWVATLSWPLLVGASLLVARLWSATPPQLALLTPTIAAIPAISHCRVFNLEGEAILVWSLPFVFVPLMVALAVARRAPAVRQLRFRRGFFAGIVAVGAIGYGMGAAYFVDTYFDRGPVRNFPTTVQSLWIKSTYGFLFKEYDVNVNPWGSHKDIDSINVDYDVMRTLRKGDEIRIEQHPGALGIPWVTIAPR